MVSLKHDPYNAKKTKIEGTSSLQWKIRRKTFFKKYSSKNLSKTSSLNIVKAIRLNSSKKVVSKFFKYREYPDSTNFALPGTLTIGKIVLSGDLLNNEFFT